MFNLINRSAVLKRPQPLLFGLLLGICLLAQGCGWNWAKLRGEGFNDEMTTSGQHLRQRQEKSDGSPLGTSNKALEIERNLGYR